MKNSIIKDYKNKMYTKDIMSKYNISWRKLTALLKKEGVYRKHNGISVSTDKENYILNNYLKFSNKEISNYLNITSESVTHIAKRLGLKNKGSGWKEHTLLCNIGPDLNSKEFNYFLGWVAADGNISKKGYAVSLSITDEIIIDNFMKIFPNACKYYEKKENQKDLYKLYISSKEFNIYIQTLGLVPNKTYILDVPQTQFNPEFVRGFFEGDGHVRTTSIKDKYTRYEAGFVCASKIFMKKLQIYLKNNDIQTTLYKEKTFFRLRITSKVTLKKFYNLIYNNCGEYYLPRKKQILDQLFSNE